MTDVATQAARLSIADSPPGWAANFAFAPDAARARRLDQGVRAGLADSLRAIFDSLGPPYAGDDPRCGALVRAVEAGPVAPSVFGTYVELVLALFDDDTDPKPILDDLLSQPVAAQTGMRIMTLDDRKLGEGQSARYRRLLREDIKAGIDPPSAEALATATAKLTDAVDLLRSGAPDLYDEFDVLIREVVLVSPRDTPDEIVFGGASTFSLWGALVLNADLVDQRLRTAQSLAHEQAHTHLFGLALGGRLVENDDAERYRSPLRKDPRPLEGVAHATFVTARMNYLLEALLASGSLDAGERTEAAGQLALNRRLYEEGLQTVLENARFTPAGQAVFDGMRQARDDRR